MRSLVISSDFSHFTILRKSTWCSTLSSEERNDWRMVRVSLSRFTVSQCVAVCCSVLQCVAVRCSVLQCVAVCCEELQCGYHSAALLYCSVLQCVAVCCSVLQCVAVCCSVL